MQDGQARTRCIFCNAYLTATPATVMWHVMSECNKHPVRDMEKLVGDLLTLLMDNRIGESNKFVIVLENGLVLLMCAEEHLGVALERLKSDQETATEVIGGLKEIMLCHKLLAMLHPKGNRDAVGGNIPVFGGRSD